MSTDRSRTFREIARAVYSEIGRLPREAQGDGGHQVYDPYFGTTSWATHIAALEIDPETHRVTLSRYVVAEDCGRLINPMIVDAQVTAPSPRVSGRPSIRISSTTRSAGCCPANLADYGLPGASEFPAIQRLFRLFEGSNGRR